MIYLLGGCTGFTGPLKTAFQKTLKYPRIAFIPSSPLDPQKSKKYMALTLQWFKAIGITFEEAYLATEAIETDIVYLMGGNPITQMTLIKDLKLEKMIESAKVIIGNSAGAINICEHTLVSKDDDFQEGLYYKGLNIAKGITVEVHYQTINKTALQRVMTEKDINMVYGIPEEEAILVDQEIHFLGTGIEVVRR